MRHLTHVLGAALALSGLCSPAYAQDAEPSICPDATAAALEMPLLVTGVIDPDDAALRSDVDYFRYTAEPGTPLTALISNANPNGAPTRTLLGVFDESCQRLASTADLRVDAVDFTVPASGSFVIGIAERSDRSFSGDGGIETRPYAFTVYRQPAYMASISGRVVDGFTHTALAGGDAPHARVSLQLCTEQGCRLVNRGSSGADGTFQFALDVNERHLPAGLYRLTVVADGYDPLAQMLLISADEARDLGDIFVQTPQHLTD